MATLLLFGPARQAAGTKRADIDAPTLGALCEAACDRFGQPFASVLRTSALWLNGETAPPESPIGPEDEVAVVPPVSGGA